MRLSLLREHIREMLYLLMEESTSGGDSAGAGDTHPNVPQGSGTGTTGTKPTTKTGTKPPAGANASVINRLSKASNSPALKQAAKALSMLTPGSTGYVKTLVAGENTVGKSLEQNAQKAREDRGQVSSDTDHNKMFNEKLKDLIKQRAEARKQQSADKKLAQGDNVSSTKSSAGKIEDVMNNSFQVATGQKPKT